MKKTVHKKRLMKTMDDEQGERDNRHNVTDKIEDIPISIIIPAFNEEQAIIQQIKSVKDVLDQKNITYEIIVVDDGSSDGTRERIQMTETRLISHKENRGYGAALKTGISAASYETVVTIDADGTYPAEAIPELLKNANDYDMVVGARIGPSVEVPLIRKPAKWFLRKLAEYLAGRKIPDLNSGLRVMKKSLVEKFDHILPSGFSFTTTMTLALYCNDYSIYYHPIDYNRRVGSSKIRPFDAYHFLILILRTIVYFNPLKVFLPLGAILFTMGLAKFIYDLFLENLSESAILGFLGASIIWAIGLLSDQIARIGLTSKAK